MVMRFDPFRELDRLSEQALGGQRGRQPVMPMDAYRRGDQFFVHFDLPGVDSSSIDLTVEKNVLTVTAERTWHRQDDDQIVVVERPQGSFSRQLFLGEGVDTERVAASYDQGVLTLTIPMAEKAKPRRVQVSSGNSTQTPIDTSSSQT